MTLRARPFALHLRMINPVWFACGLAVCGCHDHFVPPDHLQTDTPDLAPILPTDLDAAWDFYVEALLTEQCDVHWLCPEVRRVVSVTGARFGSLAECRSKISQALSPLWPADNQPLTRAALERSLSSNTTAWNPDAAAACLAALKTPEGLCALGERAEFFSLGQWPADTVCADALLGLGVEGAPCEGGWACGHGLVCKKESPLDCEGRCAPRSVWRCGGDGLSDQCPALHHCEDVSCVPSKRAGDVCEQISECASDLGLLCEGFVFSPQTAGVCVGLSDAVRAAEGAACGFNPCAVGLSCVAGRCARPVMGNNNTPCDFLSAPPKLCDAGLACITDAAFGAIGVCGVAAIEGQPCTHNDQCHWDLRCDNSQRCAPPLDIGKRCEHHTDCGSFFCSPEGFCRTRPQACP